MDKAEFGATRKGVNGARTHGRQPASSDVSIMTTKADTFYQNPYWPTKPNMPPPK